MFLTGCPNELTESVVYIQRREESTEPEDEVLKMYIYIKDVYSTVEGG